MILNYMSFTETYAHTREPFIKGLNKSRNHPQTETLEIIFSMKRFCKINVYAGLVL